MIRRLFDQSRSVTFINAIVAHATGERGSSVRVSGSRVAGLDVAPARGDLVIDCHGAVILPGLVNAHDHLELNSFGRLKWRDRYDNVAQWFDDFQPRFATEPALAANRPDTLDDRLVVGALKNLLSGVTTVCHHNPMYARLRNGFPLHVVRRFGWGHSLHLDGDRLKASYRRTPARWPWVVHAAEGTDRAAAAEFARLDALGCVGPNTVLVHGVGLRPADHLLAQTRSCGLVWCPSSNRFLFGATADVRKFSARGHLALGTDSRLSGEGDLLDELRAAHETGLLRQRDLLRAVTTDAASVLRLRHRGRLAEGLPADLAIVPAGTDDPSHALIAARRADLRLVMIGGRPAVADPDLAEVFAVRCVEAAPVRLDGRAKILDAALAERARRATIREPGLEVPA